MTNSITACSLDCYDACAVTYDAGRLKAFKSGHTQGFLCPHLNHYEKFETISIPRYKGEKITLDEALVKLKELLMSSNKDEILHYRGSGNFGLMQEVTDHFFSSCGATLTDGTLCDGAGEAGIIKGRGSNKNMPLSEIAKSDVVITWGRNPHVTSSHLLPLIKDKEIIVIDPVKTKIAKAADLHIQIKPHSDLYLAMILTHFFHMNHDCDTEYLNGRASGFEDFYELAQSINTQAVLEDIGATFGQIEKVLEILHNKKVAIVCGVGIQKYSDGADVMRAIDAFAVTLGLFGKEGCGVSYLGNSKEGISSPFNSEAKRVSKVNTEFSNFKTVFIQGANPLQQMPDSLRVKKSISRVENLVYFGLYENETSEIADLVIPAKSFLYKDDVRTSYSHNAMMNMSKVAQGESGISEYDLSAYLCKEFAIELESEEFYLEHFKSFCVEKTDGSFRVKDREAIPYRDYFDTQTREFLFLREFEPYSFKNEGLYLITPKSAKSLNSQFNREEYVYLHSSLGFADDSEVTVSSINGTVTLPVKNSDNLREDCVLIYSGTRGVNNLTSSKHSSEGKSAIFQENRVQITQASKLK